MQKKEFTIFRFDIAPERPRSLTRQKDLVKVNVSIASCQMAEKSTMMLEPLFN